jgi:hypothetical protein
MTTQDLRTQVRAEIKNLGLTKKDVSIKVDHRAVRVKALHLNVDVDLVESVLSKFENYERDEATGEILCGGNTYVFVSIFKA